MAQRPSIVLTIFLIGYAFSNIFGGVFAAIRSKNSHSDESAINLVDCDRFCRIYLVSVRYF